MGWEDSINHYFVQRLQGFELRVLDPEEFGRAGADPAQDLATLVQELIVTKHKKRTVIDASKVALLSRQMDLYIDQVGERYGAEHQLHVLLRTQYENLRKMLPSETPQYQNTNGARTARGGPPGSHQA